MLLFCLNALPLTVAATRAGRRRRLRERLAAKRRASTVTVSLETSLMRIALGRPPGKGGRLAIKHYQHASGADGEPVSCGLLLQMAA